MIKRLRKNIICVNMLLVGIVILAIFGVVCFNSYQTAYSSLEHGMTDVLKKGNRMDDEAPISEKIGKRDFKGEMPMQLSSYVIVELNDDNSVKSKTENNLSIDSEILEKCISYVTSHHEHNGQLNEYSLMYARDDFQEETKIIFTENSSVYNAFFNTLIISALLFLASMVVIALISLWLSGFAVKPVKKAADVPSAIVAMAAPSPAPPLTPMMCGSASGLRNTACICAPLAASAPPAIIAVSARGTRSFHSTAPVAHETPPPPTNRSNTSKIMRSNAGAYNPCGRICGIMLIEESSRAEAASKWT